LERVKGASGRIELIFCPCKRDFLRVGAEAVG